LIVKSQIAFSIFSITLLTLEVFSIYLARHAKCDIGSTRTHYEESVLIATISNGIATLFSGQLGWHGKKGWLVSRQKFVERGDSVTNRVLIGTIRRAPLFTRQSGREGLPTGSR